MNKKLPFWERANSLIKQQNTTQAEVSRKCDFTSTRRLQNLTSGGRYPDCDEGVKIAKALNTTVEYLVTGETGINVVLTPDENKLLSIYRKTPKMFKEIAMKVLTDFSKADDPGDNYVTYDVSDYDEDELNVAEKPPVE
jgi:transcriptional regulator with XRE-family HTH domain